MLRKNILKNSRFFPVFFPVPGFFPIKNSRFPVLFCNFPDLKTLIMSCYNPGLPAKFGQSNFKIRTLSDNIQKSKKSGV